MSHLHLTPSDHETAKHQERDRLSQEISERDDFAAMVITSSPSGILAYDRDVRYTLWNPAMERISGMKKEQVLGKVAFEVFPFLKDQGVDRAFLSTLEGRTVEMPPQPYTVPETGAQGYFEQTSCPLYDEDGQVAGGLIFVRDVTKHRLEIQALEKKIAELESRP